MGAGRNPGQTDRRLRQGIRPAGCRESVCRAADRINAGYTVKQIADPYIQSQARLLELNPDSIGLSDPSIQQALMSKDQSGKPAAMSVWEYEQQLRNDPGSGPRTPRTRSWEQPRASSSSGGDRLMADYSSLLSALSGASATRRRPCSPCSISMGSARWRPR